MLKLFRIVIFSLSGVFILLISISVKDYKPTFKTVTFRTEEVALLEPGFIFSQSGVTVKPIHYIGKINFASINPEERKEKFIQYLLPSVIIVKDKLLNDLHRIEFIEKRLQAKAELSLEDAAFFKETMQLYEAESINDLKIKLYPPPVSLILAQAALESGWGTSRIFRLANNPFGIISSSREDTRIKNLLLSDIEVEIFMRSYSSVTEAVEHYCLITSKLRAYKQYREKRWEGASSTELIQYLDKYHRSDDYLSLAKSIISQNRLQEYDIMTIDPQYVNKEGLLSMLMKN
jgi:Bax protein